MEEDKEGKRERDKREGYKCRGENKVNRKKRRERGGERNGRK